MHLAKVRANKYIEQFAKKYPDGTPSFDSLDALNSLLPVRWRIPELIGIIEEERQRQEHVQFRRLMLVGDPASRTDYYHKLLDIYGDEYHLYLSDLIDLLHERQLDVSHVNVFEEIEELKEEIRIDRFKQALASPDPLITIHDIDIVNGYEFERLLGRLFGKMGYQVEQTKLSQDQGADLVLTKLGERIVVQAKRQVGAVGNKAIQEVAAAVNHYGAQRGMVVTNNKFTTAAVALARSNRIELIDRKKLEDLIGTYLY